MDDNSQQITFSERRRKPRMVCQYPAIVHGSDSQGKKYRECGQLVNLSSNGMFLAVDRKIIPGEELSVIVRLTDSTQAEEAPKLAVSGVVIRAESQFDGGFGIAVRFHRYRFL